MLPVVAIIITTKNSHIHIQRCLESIRIQDYPKELIEIIVVDNNSADDTQAIAKHYTDYVYNFGPERSAQRNYGVKNATGKYVLYLDVDMALSKALVAECVKICEQSGLFSLYVPERIVGAGFWIKVRDFERGFYNATAIDCVRFFKKDKFVEAGGFDEGLTGPEDWDFSRRVSALGKVGIVEPCIYHDEGEFNFKRYINKKLYYAQTFDKYINKWGRNDPLVRKQLGIWYRYCGVFLENGKFIKLIFHPFLSAGLLFLRVSLGFNYLFLAK